MKIAVFCDSIGRIPEFHARLAVGGHADDLIFIVTNNVRRPFPLFLAAQLKHSLLRFRPKDWLAFGRDMLARRVFIGTAPLSSPATVAFLDRIKPDLGLHAMGVIYREEIIGKCGLGILNAHIGQLPKYRGRSVMEWSLLCGDPTGITVFFIDSGIDTGRRVVFFHPEPVTGIPDLDKAKRHLFSKDAELYRQAIDRIRAAAPLADNDIAQGRRFYEMSALFRNALQTHLESRADPAKVPPRQHDSASR